MMASSVLSATRSYDELEFLKVLNKEGSVEKITDINENEKEFILSRLASTGLIRRGIKEVVFIDEDGEEKIKYISTAKLTILGKQTLNFI